MPSLRELKVISKQPLRHQDESLFHYAEFGEKTGDFVGVLAKPGGDVCHAVEAEVADHCVAAEAQALGPVTEFHAAFVFAEGNVANPVKAVLDSPMATPPRVKLPGPGQTAGNAGDGVVDLDGHFALVFPGPRNFADLSHPGPVEMFRQPRAGLEMTRDQPPVLFVADAVFIKMLLPLPFCVGGKSRPRTRPRSLLAKKADCL